MAQSILLICIDIPAFFPEALATGLRIQGARVHLIDPPIISEVIKEAKAANRFGPFDRTVLVIPRSRKDNQEEAEAIKTIKAIPDIPEVEVVLDDCF